MQEEHDTPTRILRALRFRPKGMTITEVAKQIGATRNSVSKHLEILQIAGKVDVRVVGNAKVYSLAQRVPMSAFLCFTKNLILILDESQRIVQVNDQCLKALRRSKDDLIGLTLEEAALPVVSTPEAISFIEGLEREQVVTDLRCRSDGKDFFYQMQAIPTTFDDGETGCTLVLEDITERKRYVRNMEFLARTAMELVDMPAEADIYQYIGKRIIELVPGGCVYVFSYDEIYQQFSLRATEGEGFHDGLIQILGRDPIGLVVPLTEIFSLPSGGSPMSLLHGGIKELIFYPEIGPEGLSFYDLCFRQIPEDICEEIRRTWNLGKVYITFLVWGEQLFGDVGIFMAPHEKLEDQQAVESFLRQASIALARRQTEDRLRRSESRFRDVIDSSPVAAAIIESDGRYSYLNRAFTDLFGYTLADIPTGRDWFRQAFPDPDLRSEAIAAWKADLAQAGRGTPRPRTFSVRCRDGEEKTILFSPVELSDGTQYVTCEDLTEERRAYRVLVGEITRLRQRRKS
ncbi:PAS domain S-box protein [Methanoculleus sp. FWC-SCC1]|uniref:PAS domain S-box protein n=1 Tax=Methanoculleus frigidifontis TaxID=2584085 RepID=A0ABT8MDZ5_9EURY|nr:PAS domain S-box protein [Methanoculleus sp. FWC-SCC1]MDN7026129.1 PAS domain S-box protein [Methanoculleus sp. FWC-SCC1]